MPNFRDQMHIFTHVHESLSGKLKKHWPALAIYASIYSGTLDDMLLLK